MRVSSCTPRSSGGASAGLAGETTAIFEPGTSAEGLTGLRIAGAHKYTMDKPPACRNTDASFAVINPPRKRGTRQPRNALGRGDYSRWVSSGTTSQRAPRLLNLLTS